MQRRYCIPSLRFSAFSTLVFALTVSNLSGSTQVDSTAHITATDQTRASNFAAKESIRQQAIQDHLRKADEFRNRYADPKAEGKVSEAKAKEALELVEAIRLGDKSQDARLSQLASEVGADTKIPVRLRLQVASSVAYQAVDRGLPTTARLAAFETIARKHAREFPECPVVYETLVHLAEQNPDDSSAQKLARDVLAMTAPKEIKAYAQLVLDRHALVGRSVAGLLDSKMAARVAGKPVILYSWSGKHLGLLSAIKAIKKQAPANTVFIGVCIDSDVAQAKATASTQSLPGELLYDAKGAEGDLAKVLVFSFPGIVYAADIHGKIRSPSVASDVSAKLAALSIP
jgi:hypothetical protein